MLKHNLRAAVVFFFATCVSAAELRPLGDLAGFIEPDTPAVLRWELEKGELPAKVDYVIRDYVEREVSRGTIDFVPGKPLELSVKLPQGYYDVELAGASQRYGLVALPQPAKESNPFFCIDAAMSWLVRDEALRVAMVKKLARCGIRTARERVTWSAINPAEGKYDWETPAKFESLRKLYAANGIKVLEMFHDAPAWTGRVGKYPDDLVATVKAWRDIRARWGQYWCGLEVWNEPDIFFGGDLPADQYASLAQAFAVGYGWEAWSELTVGAYAHYNPAFMDNAAENGVQYCAREMSFHTYDRAPAMAATIKRYRESQARPIPSLCITECGRPWKKGPPRPPRAEDAESALDITMKAIEAFQHDVAKYFAFVYPYYEENQNNFGMTDRRGLPLRSMAAYARLASILGPDVSTTADLKVTADAPITRVFQTRDATGAVQNIAVIYTGKVDSARTVRVDLPIVRVEGIDGRKLTAKAGAVPVPDGLAYVWLGTPLPKIGFCSIAMFNNPDGIFAAGFAIPSPAGQYLPPHMVLRFEWDKDGLRAHKEGYRVVMDRAGKVRLTFHAFNLREAAEGTIKLDLADTGVRPVGDAGPWKYSMKPDSRQAFSCDVDLREAFAKRDTITLKAKADNSETLAVRLIGEPTFEQLLKRYPQQTKLPIADVARWQHGAPSYAKDEITKADDGAWRLKVSFGPGDKWCYPRFTLPAEVDLSKSTALILRARCQKAGAVRVFLWEDENVGYFTTGSIVSADGKWHTATVRFSDLTHSGVNAPDPNSKLDLDKVRRISIGFNSETAENTLEVSEAYVVK